MECRRGTTPADWPVVAAKLLLGAAGWTEDAEWAAHGQARSVTGPAVPRLSCSRGWSC
ncbi:PIN domain-containing protein [Streptosporangium canum]|uniref:PIN domain-containing protein n=1 Tax=Streptosporangium canum TaxID=324952 RepID=UPI0036775CB5